MVYFTDNIVRVRGNGKVTSNLLDIHVSINDNKWLLKIRKSRVWEETWRAQRAGHGPGAGNHLLAAADIQLQTEIVLWFPSQLPRHLARRCSSQAVKPGDQERQDSSELWWIRCWELCRVLPCSTLAKSRLSRLRVSSRLLLVTAGYGRNTNNALFCQFAVA